MFNIPSHKGNANPNYTKIPPHSSKIGNHQENKQQQMLVRTWGEGQPSYTVGKNVNWHNHYGNQ
jgi:hypothetical protein